jgi:hypothetical protein
MYIFNLEKGQSTNEIHLNINFTHIKFQSHKIFYFFGTKIVSNQK